MSDLITGYQYGDDFSFIGTYEFPNNQDKEDIHLPPRTVLIKPPVAKDGSKAFWDGDQWIIRETNNMSSGLPSIEVMTAEETNLSLVAK